MANAFDTHFMLNCLAGAVIATVFAFLIGLPVLKLKGHYFALVTFGVAEAVKGLVNNWTDFTGGGRGMSLPQIFPDIASNYTVFYYIFIAILFITALASYLIKRSRIGYALFAIREDEEGAASMGINTAKYKNIAFSYSAVFFGLCGGVYAYWLSYIDTLAVFSVHLSVNVILMTVLGGAATVMGPILGAFVFQGFSEVLRNNFLTTHSLLLGILMIIVIMFVPKGFMDLLGGRRKFTWSMLLENVRWYKE
jgi:branched-chain amino acid transport system permease protein